MPNSAIEELSHYAIGLRSEDIPKDVGRLAQLCLADAVACAAYGARFDWSGIVQEYAMVSGKQGVCRLPHLDLPAFTAETASLLAGTFAHAFELDSLRKPGAGVHPGATVALPALMVAQEVGAGHDDLIRAIVAGIEVMFRIGNATLHSAEGRGFHAPGFTGPFGAATAAALLHGLTEGQFASAMGIAASCGGGLLAFAAGGGGGMVKRLHLGRAAAGGVLAAELARRGFEGPSSALEGRYGLLEAYCPVSDAAQLTAGLGAVFETRCLCIKHYACHVTAQSPVELLRDLMSEHAFVGEEIKSISLGVGEKVRTHHSSCSPTDVAGAQYSVPFAVATAAFDDPEDPLAFERSVHKSEVIDLARRIKLHPQSQLEAKWGVEMIIEFFSGRIVQGSRETFLGTPEQPMTDNAFAEKFSRLVGQKHSYENLSRESWLRSKKYQNAL